MRNYNSYLPHTASKIVKTMTLPCAMCCSHCHMTLRLCQLPCGTVTCHCHVLLSLPHGTECTATAMWQKKVTTPPRKCKGIQVSLIKKNIVEIDETLLVQRKHKKDCIFNQIWLFGGIKK